MDINEARDNKIAELNYNAEVAFWSTFKTSDQLPIMNAFKILIILAINRRPLTQAERSRLASAVDVAEKLAAKHAQVLAVDTVDAVENIRW